MIQFVAYKNEDEMDASTTGELRYATADEVATHFRIKVIGDGLCEIVADEGYSVMDADLRD